jgi:alkanesulfonate monooxygenase SsuD/methylene tetrahydromethanopterin reductase-like flavin-dependent oxidoreductase (luciferase family)
LKFGVGFPTCREGTAYPTPFVRPEDFPRLAQHAEALGFYSLWGNDHLTTPFAIRATQGSPPNFYEPLLTYASLAYITQRIRFLIGVLVLPEREIILLAKQLATLDQLTNGRVMLGVGIGGYREEFEAIHPELKGVNRGRIMEEGIVALRQLFTEPRSSFAGKYIKFKVVDAAARRAGRDPRSIGTHFQIWLTFGKDREMAIAKLKRSQHWRRTMAMARDSSEEEQLGRYAAGNLLGSPVEVIDQIRTLEQQAGVEHMGIVMLGESLAELMEDMQLFAHEVMPAFSDGGS